MANVGVEKNSFPFFCENPAFCMLLRKLVFLHKKNSIIGNPELEESLVVVVVELEVVANKVQFFDLQKRTDFKDSLMNFAQT